MQNEEYCGVHAIRAEQIMVRNVVSLSKRCTYRDIQKVLVAMPRCTLSQLLANQVGSW